MRRILVCFLLIMTSQLFAGRVFYVDATNGNNQNNGLSEANAWKTINKVNHSSFSPGDTILFKRGQIWYEMLDIDWSGAEGNPIIFGAYGTGSRPIISGATKAKPTTPRRPFCIYLENKRYINIENIETKYADMGGIWILGEMTIGKTRYVNVMNCVSHHNGGHGFKASQDTEIEIPTCQHVTFNNCTAYSNGFHGFQASDGSGDISYINCTSYDNGRTNPDEGAGFRFGETATGLARGCVSYGNDFGVRIEGWESSPSGITVEECDLHDNKWYGIEILGPVNWVHKSITIQRNKIYNNKDSGIYVTNVIINNGLCAYNVVYGNSKGGILWQLYTAGGGNSEIYNNVIAGNNPGLEIGDDANVIVKNNILYKNSTQLWASSGIFDYNLYYPDVSFSRKGLHDVSADPLFQDAPNHNYHLRPNSPCINTGTEVALTKDCEGNSVPYRYKVDIGAYEYIGENPPLVPTRKLEIML